MLVNVVNKLLSLGVIASQIFIVAVFLWFLFFRKTQNVITEFMSNHGLRLAFAVALLSMSGSLFYSQIAGFAPCDLCWFQRFFMYPLVFLLGFGLIKPAGFSENQSIAPRDVKIINSGLILSAIGGLISLYHNYMYYYNGGLNVFCQLSGIQVSCVKRYVFEFGYITIPMMALTAFVLIIIFLLFKKYKNNI